MKEFGPGFYNITDLLTEEELLIHKTAYEFVQSEFMPVINEHYESATFPIELVPKLGELGFMGSAPESQLFRSVPHHCSHFDIDERALLVGTSIFAQLIEDQLME